MHQFEKYEDLPTRGAHALEQFSFDGSLFLAFANYNGDLNAYSTDSFIYKVNNSTNKFSLFQTIDTTGGRDFEYFTIADKHYLAIANRHSGSTSQLNSHIYVWNGNQFVFLQNILTIGATSFTFVKILPQMFLAVTNTDGTNSAIYHWKDNQFEKFQDLATANAKASTAFVIHNNTFIVFANYKSAQEGYSVKSPVFKWSGGSFVQFQSLQTYGAFDVKSFKTNDDRFIVFANHYDGSSFNIDSFIYKWDGSKFLLFQSIPTRGARAWWPFVMCGQTFLGVANNNEDGQGKNTQSTVYKASEVQFVQYQEISTHGANDITAFEHKGHTYLAIANSINNGKRNINSVVYNWI